MVVEDSWRLKNGAPSRRDGRGLRYRVRVEGYPTRSFRVKAAADRYNGELVAGLRVKRASDLTVDELAARWLATKAGLSQKGREACATAARVVCVRWAGVLAADVTRDDLEAWIPTTGRSGAARRKVHQAMRGALQIAVELGVIDKNPAEKLRVPDSQRREAVYLSAAELQALAEAAGPYRPMVLFMGTTAVRLGEACAMTVGDVDRARRRARVRRSKNGLARDVPVPLPVLELLDLGRPLGEPLFTSPEGGPVNQHNWRDRVFYPASGRRRDEAGRWLEPPRVRPHDLRHTAVSLAIAAGADVKVVQRMAGHKSAAMTLDVYADLFDESLDTVAARMGRLLG